MAKGKARATLLGIQGQVQHTQAPNWDFLYRRSTVRDSDWNIGDRVVTPDGRVFRYAKASGTMQCDYPAVFANNEFIEYSSIATAQAVGDKEVTITVSASAGGEDADGVFDVDELRGGYIAIFKSGLGDAITRGIVGNTAKAALGTSITIYLDASLDRAVTDSDAAEVSGNPYAKVKDNHAAGDSFASVAGLPNVPATTGQYFWLQTYGPRWMSPAHAGIGGASNEREAYFLSAGIDELTYSSSTYLDRQHAGFLIDKTTSGSDGAPFIMLQISS